MPSGKYPRTPRKRLNPNLAAFDERALQVPCPYCGARVGEDCWALRAVLGEPKDPIHAPHRSRMKVMVHRRLRPYAETPDEDDGHLP